MRLGMEIKTDTELPATSWPIVTTAATSSLSDLHSQGSSAGPIGVAEAGGAEHATGHAASTGSQNTKQRQGKEGKSLATPSL